VTTKNPVEGFARWLEQQRLSKGWTIKQAAEAAELSASTWSTYETGGRRVRGEWVVLTPENVTLVRIAKALDVPESEVFAQAGRQWQPVEPPVVEPGKVSVLERLDRVDERIAHMESLLAELLHRLGSNNPSDRPKR
jgi:transcriptional regulator with XRE-family HTH domain